MELSLEPAFVLHQRPYKESSALVDIFSKMHGKLSLVAKGLRRQVAWLNALQLFQPLLISAQGRGELLTLTHIETQAAAYHLKAEQLFSGFYINELLSRLLAKQDPHPALFVVYENLLIALEHQTAEQLQPNLRYFEKCLLKELGYGLSLDTHKICATQNYQYEPEVGLIRCVDAVALTTEKNIFSGACLLAIANDNLQDVHSLRAAKRLMRLALQPLLGDKPLKSRDLFRGN